MRERPLWFLVWGMVLDPLYFIILSMWTRQIQYLIREDTNEDCFVENWPRVDSDSDKVYSTKQIQIPHQVDTSFVHITNKYDTC